jgi:hypothetical protein
MYYAEVSGKKELLLVVEKNDNDAIAYSFKTFGVNLIALYKDNGNGPFSIIYGYWLGG